MLKELEEWCSTDRQRETLRLYIEHGGNAHDVERATAGSDNQLFASNINRLIRNLKIKAGKAGYGEHYMANVKLPDHMFVERTTTRIDRDKETGEISVGQQYIKTNTKAEDIYTKMIEAWGEYANTLPKAKLTPPPECCEADLLCDYTIGDAHIGMYAWAREAGDDWDLEKGVDILRKGINHLISASPKAETAFILDVGDFLHADNQSNETSHSGNKLDVDGRYSKVQEAAIRCIIDMIDMALQKHSKVIYRSVIGNHNEHVAKMMNITIKLKYENEPRLEVMDSPAMHNYYQFGVNLLADTHGHTSKSADLPLLMATDAPEMWAQTVNRVWRTGHVHHESVKEYSGAKVITYRTLTPKDAWHAGAGYRSNRDMRCTIYHRENGTVGMNVVNPTMLGY